MTDTTDAAVLTFDGGIPGLDQGTRFTLADLTEDGMFQELVCVDVPDLTLVVASPWLFFPDYAPDLPDADTRGLDIETPEDVALFCSVIVDGDHLAMNLRAPFVANAHTHAARQVVLDADEPLRAPLLAADTAGRG